jgi:hypothetical protein
MPPSCLCSVHEPTLPSAIMIRNQGCQIFLRTRHQRGKNIPNDRKIYQMAIRYFLWTQTWPNGHKICQDFPLQGPPKFTQIGIFGLRTNHLATLSETQSTKNAKTWLQKMFDKKLQKKCSTKCKNVSTEKCRQKWVYTYVGTCLYWRCGLKKTLDRSGIF